MIDSHSINQVFLVGRVGKDPEVKEINGHPFSKFSLATNRGKFEGEEWVEQTEWHTIVCWNAQAKFSERIQKGQLVSVIGSIHYSQFEDKEKINRNSVEITAEKLVLLEGRKERE